MEEVFVYGTLKQGGSNHHYLSGQQFLGLAQTEPGYAMYDLGGYPGILETEDAVQAIHGEVWAVDAACLLQLDALEGLATGEYERVYLPLQGQWAGRPVWGYLYCWSVLGRPRLGGVW
jgi:gamma-glutamylaminecyclotransferase